jgi:hypothetical protein
MEGNNDMKLVYEVVIYAGHDFDKVVYRQHWADGTQAFKDCERVWEEKKVSDPEWASGYYGEVKAYEVK